MILIGKALEKAVEETMSPKPEVDEISVDVHVPFEVTVPKHGYSVISAFERLDMKEKYAAMITGRSSHMQNGVTMPGGFVDPSFSGDFKLEFFNHSGKDFVIEDYEAGGRLTFFEVKQ